MRLTVIGTGNVATVLANRFYVKGWTIQEVYGRDMQKTQILADMVKATAVNDIEKLSKEIDVVIIALSDKALSSVVSQLSFPNSLVLHTAGSVSKNVLQKTSENFGVLYPVQSMRKGMNDETPIPFLIDGNHPSTIDAIEKIAFVISQEVARGNDELRLKLHVAAVFVCNFPNFLYMQSALFCETENIPFRLLQDLMEETANRIRYNHPSEVFTGPAIRGDMETVQKHLAVLQSLPYLQALYRTLTEQIVEWKKRHL